MEVKLDPGDDFRIDKNKPGEAPANIREESFGVGIDGQSIIHTSNRSYAKLVKQNGNVSYYIRCRGGNFFNPFDSINRNDQISQFEYKRVNKCIFDLYETFLRTRNTVRLREAERRLIDL